VAILVLAALVIRHRSVQDFNKKQRADGFAQYVVETIHKKPQLHKSHGFFIDPALSEHAVQALQKHLPQAIVTVKGALISLTTKQSTWVIPICTTEEYTELYI
jgi:hypothetical protein